MTTRVIDVSPAYMSTLCLTFLDLRKVYLSAVIETFMEVSNNQRVPTQYMDIFSELNKNLKADISQFYYDIKDYIILLSSNSYVDCTSLLRVMRSFCQ